MHRLWQHDERIRLSSPVEQWPRDAALARARLAAAQERLRNREQGRRAAAAVRAWAGGAYERVQRGVHGCGAVLQRTSGACRCLPHLLSFCRREYPTARVLYSSFLSRQAPPPPPVAPPEGPKAAYVMSTAELRKKNREVGWAGARLGLASGHAGTGTCLV